MISHIRAHIALALARADCHDCGILKVTHANTKSQNQQFYALFAHDDVIAIVLANKQFKLEAHCVYAVRVKLQSFNWFFLVLSEFQTGSL